MDLNVSSSTIPLGHSCSRKEERNTFIRIIQSIQRNHLSTGTYVFKASIERLKLLPGELCLSLQLIQPLRLVPHRRQLQITVATVCGRKKERERKRKGNGWTVREKKKGEEWCIEGWMKRKKRQDGADTECVEGGAVHRFNNFVFIEQVGKSCKFRMQAIAGVNKEVLSLWQKWQKTTIFKANAENLNVMN